MMIRSTSRVAFVVLVACAAAAFAATVLAQPSPAAVSGPPAVSGLVSPTHPLASAWYADSNPSFSWRAVSATPTSAGYSYVLDQDPTTVPDTVVDLAAFGFAPKRDTAITPFPVALAAGDFNRDGRADLALVNDSPAHARSDTVTILQATSNGGFRRLHPVKVAAFSNSIAVADLNHDGKADLVVGTPTSYLQATPSISVLLGRGSGTFAAPHVYRIGSLDSTGPAGPFLIADVNGDHKPDLLATQGGRLIVLLGRGNGTFGPEHTFVVDPNGWIASLAFGDLNGDGRTDLVAGSGEGAHRDVGALSVLLGKGDGSFKAAVALATGELFPGALALSDVNHDGKLDLLVGGWVDGGDGGPSYCAVGVCLGKGNGSFSPAVQYVVGQFSPSGFAVADFNHDGKSDLLVTTLAGLYVLLGNGDGSFQPAVAFGTLLRAGVTAVGDFNRDGRPDVAVVGSRDDTVSVFLNRSNVASYHGLTDGVWYFHVRAVDTGAVGGPTATRAVRIDTQRPSTQAPTAASARTGAVAHLAYEVSDPPPSAGWCTVHIVVRNGRGVVLHRHTSGHVRSGVLCQTGFRCDLARGTYRFYVYATDAAGNRQSNVAWNRLVVR
jgi:hypothetical protein